jgi:FdhE protein
MPRGRGEFGDLPREGIGQPDPILLPDPRALFARRAARLRMLANDNPMAEWLRFVARLADAQQSARPPTAAVAVTEGTPPLLAVTHRRAAWWHDALARVLFLADDAAAPPEARAVLRDLRTRDPEPLADAWLRGEPLVGQAGATMAVVAALQVYFTHLVASLPLTDLTLQTDRRVCPVCGQLPVAGVITAAGKAPGTRYLHCGLCATAWNHVRAVCTGCGESKSLALHEIEGGTGAVRAETCDECHGYAKMLYQDKDMDIEPMADDLASLGLDIMVSDAGWFRLAPNPLLPMGV